jgi:hypothetical protein
MILLCPSLWRLVVHKNFGGTYCLHLQDRRGSHANNHRYTNSSSCCLVAVWSSDSLTLKKNAIRSSETLLNYTVLLVFASQRVVILNIRFQNFTDRCLNSVLNPVSNNQIVSSGPVCGMPCTWTAGDSLFINFSRCVTDICKGPTLHIALILHNMYSGQVVYTELLEAELFYSWICVSWLFDLSHRNTKLTHFLGGLTINIMSISSISFRWGRWFVQTGLQQQMENLKHEAGP